MFIIVSLKLTYLIYVCANPKDLKLLLRSKGKETCSRLRNFNQFFFFFFFWLANYQKYLLINIVSSILGNFSSEWIARWFISRGSAFKFIFTWLWQQLGFGAEFCIMLLSWDINGSLILLVWTWADSRRIIRYSGRRDSNRTLLIMWLNSDSRSCMTQALLLDWIQLMFWFGLIILEVMVRGVVELLFCLCHFGSTTDSQMSIEVI